MWAAKRGRGGGAGSRGGGGGGNFDQLVGVALKTEPEAEPMTTEQCVLQIIKDAGKKGVSDDDLVKACPALTINERVDVINALIRSARIALHHAKDTLRYRYNESAAAAAAAAVGGDDVNAEELVVFNLIRDAGSKGIWVRDVRVKSNLTFLRLKKILKSLEAKKAIKAVKSVAASRKIVYMLYDVEPDSSITGGAWYSDQEFEAEVVQVLTKHSHRFLEAKRTKAQKNTSVRSPLVRYNDSYATAERVLEFIVRSGIVNLKLGVQDIECILDILVYDGVAAKRVNAHGQTEYRSTRSLVKRNVVSCVPCGSCPVIKKCSDDNQLNCVNCVHMKKWTTV